MKVDKELFGSVAIQRGFITPDQLVEALKVQAEGQLRRRIGEILQEQGAMTYSEVGQVIMGLGMITNIQGP
jgi:hypothetical protein